MWPSIPRYPDKRKKKEKPTPGRIRNKTKSQWENYLPVFKQWEKKKLDKSTIVAPLPRDPDKRKKKEKPTTGRVRNKTESQWENYLPVFKQRKKKKKRKR